MGSKLTRSYLPEIFALRVRRLKPVMLTVNLTHRCNQHCIYCEIGVGKIPQAKSDALKREDLYWLIDQMTINNIPKISLCGGEPFLFEGILDVVAYAGQRNIRCSVTTNGMTAFSLSEEELSILQKYHTEINISIDSFKEEIQTLTRGSRYALQNALKSFQKLDSKGIPVTVLCVISSYNYLHLLDYIKTAYKQGIKQVLFQPVIYYSNYPDVPAIDQKSGLNIQTDQIPLLTDELKRIFYFEKRHRIKTNVYRILPWISDYLETANTGDEKMFFEKVLKKFYCRDLDAIVDISFDGGIQACGLAQARVNIFDSRQAGLIALWHDATEVLRQELHEDRFPAFCNGCCHHFSRNMLASLIKFPIKNRKALLKIFPLLLSRTFFGVLKKLKLFK